MFFALQQMIPNMIPQMEQHIPIKRTNMKQQNTNTRKTIIFRASNGLAEKPERISLHQRKISSNLINFKPSLHHIEVGELFQHDCGNIIV